MKPIHFLAAIALLAPGSALAQAADWRVVDTTAHGTPKQNIMLVDAASLTRQSGDIRMVWTSSIFMQVQTIGTDTSYDEMRIEYRLDCAANTFAIRGISVWQDGTQKLETQSDGEPVPINPNSPAADAAKAACTGDFSSLARITTGSPSAERRRRFGG